MTKRTNGGLIRNRECNGNQCQWYGKKKMYDSIQTPAFRLTTKIAELNIDLFYGLSLL